MKKRRQRMENETGNLFTSQLAQTRSGSDYSYVNQVMTLMLKEWVLKRSPSDGVLTII